MNLDLHQTLRVVYANRESVTMWGPLLIRKEAYDKSLHVLRVIASGAAQYRAISTPRNLLISDCIHAVAAVDPDFGREHYPLIRIGKPASRYIARQIMMRGPVDQRLHDNSWLIPRLGLGAYPIRSCPRGGSRRSCCCVGARSESVRRMRRGRGPPLGRGRLRPPPDEAGRLGRTPRAPLPRFLDAAADDRAPLRIG